MVNARTVCIGGPEADGECFVKDPVTQRLRVDDCVSVTYAPTSREGGPYRATKVSGEAVDSHPDECPGQ